MKAGRDAVRDVDDGLRSGFEISCVQDHKIGRLRRNVHNIAHQPTIILRLRRLLWHENKLAGDMARTEIMDLASASLKVMLEQF